MKIRILAILLILVCAVGCTRYEKENEYQQISQEEAKKLMDTEECIILDVRTATEFSEKHIDGAINIDHEELPEKAESMLPDKDALILVYCRTGRRSKIATQTLVDMGYTNVKEFGGIEDWKM